MTVRQKIEEDIRVRAERERQRKPEWSEGLVQQRMREESREKQIEEMFVLLFCYSFVLLSLSHLSCFIRVCPIFLD